MLSQNPWRKDNSFGNTYSNIFGKMENIEIAHIYTLNRKPEFEKNVTRYYHINEAEVIKSFFSLKRDRRVGKEIKINEIEEPEQFENKHNKSFYSKVLSFGKNHHWISLFWARELAWKYGNVDYKGLIDFVNDFKPDLFFLPYGNMFNTNRLALYI